MACSDCDCGRREREDQAKRRHRPVLPKSLGPAAAPDLNYEPHEVARFNLAPPHGLSDRDLTPVAPPIDVPLRADEPETFAEVTCQGCYAINGDVCMCEPIQLVEEDYTPEPTQALRDLMQNTAGLYTQGGPPLLGEKLKGEIYAGSLHGEAGEATDLRRTDRGTMDAAQKQPTSASMAGVGVRAFDSRPDAGRGNRVGEGGNSSPASRGGQATEPEQQVLVKYDSDKPPMHLLPLDVLTEVARVMGFGAKKYSPNGWRKGSAADAERYDAAFMRHRAALQRGEVNDPESGLPHRAHMACCAIMGLGLTLA